MKKAIAVLFISILSNVVSAEDIVQVGRYGQLDLNDRVEEPILEQMIYLTFPAKVVTIGDALNYMLAESGYSMASFEASDPQLPILMDLSLPGVHRKLQPMRLIEGLKTLASDSWILVVDPFSRLISFELNSKIIISQ